MSRLAALIVALLVTPTTAGSQPLAMPDAGPVGAGYFFSRAYRDFELSDGSTFSPDWNRAGLLIHGALAHRVVLMVTGSYEPPDTDSDFPGRIYQGLGIGAGATIYPFISGPYRIGAGAKYYRHIWHDQSVQRYDKVVDGVTVAVQFERSFTSKSLSALVWIAPAYHKDRLFEYPGVAPKAELESANNFGGILGASLVLWGHIAPYVQFEVLERVQTGAGVSYIF